MLRRPFRAYRRQLGVGFWLARYPLGGRESTIVRMSRFSKITLRCSPVPSTATSTIAQPKSSARITWLGNSTRNAVIDCAQQAVAEVRLLSRGCAEPGCIRRLLSELGHEVIIAHALGFQRHPTAWHSAEDRFQLPQQLQLLRYDRKSEN
jgi:hypothetical protein